MEWVAKNSYEGMISLYCKYNIDAMKTLKMSLDSLHHTLEKSDSGEIVIVESVSFKSVEYIVKYDQDRALLLTLVLFCFLFNFIIIMLLIVWSTENTDFRIILSIH